MPLLPVDTPACTSRPARHGPCEEKAKGRAGLAGNFFKKAGSPHSLSLVIIAQKETLAVARIKLAH